MDINIPESRLRPTPGWLGRDTYSKFGSLAIGIMVVVILVAQSRLLYVFPQPDGARWWGDETGQMLELRAELSDGYARIPTALGASLAITNGLVRGNSWLAAIVYGVPARVFSAYASIVSIGRTVTFLLSIGMLIALWIALGHLGLSRLYQWFAVLLLLSTRSFFFASHAARLDIAAGLIVLLYASYLSIQYDRFVTGGHHPLTPSLKRRGDQWKPTSLWWFCYGAVTILFATLSIHLLTLLGLLSVFVLWKFKAVRNPQHLIAAFAGVGLVIAALFGVYKLSGAPVTLFSPSVQTNQFQSVVSMLPIQRPFSRSVQIANISERITGLWREAPVVLVLASLSLLVLLIALVRRKNVNPNSAQQFFLQSTGVILVAWLLLQSPALYYYVHVLPIVIVASLIMFTSRLKRLEWVLIPIAVVLTIISVRDSVSASVLSHKIETDNSAALLAAQQVIEQTTHPKNNGPGPIVLAQNPAINALLFTADNSPARLSLMTAHLVSFPTSNLRLDEVIHQTGASYILLYASHSGTQYSEDYSTLRPLADSLGKIVLSSTGVLFDVKRDYFQPNTVSRDTLLLYRLN